MTFEELIANFISMYGTAILYTIMSAVATAVAAWIGRIYKTKVTDETKRKVVKTCCKAVEQLYKDLDGPSKYHKACEAIEEMLAKQNITITALEIEMLIEEVCYDFKHSLEYSVGTLEVAEGVELNG